VSQARRMQAGMIVEGRGGISFVTYTLNLPPGEASGESCNLGLKLAGTPGRGHTHCLRTRCFPPLQPSLRHIRNDLPALSSGTVACLRDGFLPANTPLLAFYGVLAATRDVDRAVADGLISSCLTLGVCPGVDVVPARKGAWLVEGCSTMAAENCAYRPVKDGNQLLAKSQAGENVPDELGQLVSVKCIQVGEAIKFNYRELNGKTSVYRDL
jgi:hypothetical protein